MVGGGDVDGGGGDPGDNDDNGSDRGERISGGMRNSAAVENGAGNADAADGGASTTTANDFSSSLSRMSSVVFSSEAHTAAGVEVPVGEKTAVGPAADDRELSERNFGATDKPPQLAGRGDNDADSPVVDPQRAVGRWGRRPNRSIGSEDSGISGGGDAKARDKRAGRGDAGVREAWGEDKEGEEGASSPLVSSGTLELENRDLVARFQNELDDARLVETKMSEVGFLCSFFCNVLHLVYFDELVAATSAVQFVKFLSATADRVCRTVGRTRDDQVFF